jgi:hypothetical protein
MPADFIGVYPKALDPAFCQKVIETFENSPHRHPGLTGQGVDTNKKLSEDITISHFPEWKDIQGHIQTTTFHNLCSYVESYPALLVGALSPQVIDPATQQPVTLNIDNFERLGPQYIEALLPMMYRYGTINVQKYPAGKGGYPHWHSEIYPQDSACEPLHRVLLFMYYLNDVAEGGETEFLHQKRSIRPEQGTLVIAPAGFTHTHRGNVPRSGDKYIITSWVMFQRAEKLFPQNRQQV